MAARTDTPRRVGVALAATAAALAGVALQARANASRAEREYPPRGRFLEAAGVRLHYVERGDGGGPPVVLLHGNAVMVEDFVTSGVIDLLAAQRRRVVAFDRPGYGHSDRPRDRRWTPEAQAAVFAAAFARLGLVRPVVVGHSWGTLVALALALDHPHTVSGLVLASGYYFPTARADVALFSPPALPLLGDALRYTVAPLVGWMLTPRMIAAMFAPAAVSPRFAAGVPEPMMLRPWQIRAGAEDAAGMVPAARRFTRRYRDLRRLPVAVLAGAEDRIVEVGRQSARLHRELPDSDLRVVPGLGHMVHHGAPRLVAGAVAAVAARAARAEERSPPPDAEASGMAGIID
jgi:pimeloyl-ACP methyl ester carboxylesterase